MSFKVGDRVVCQVNVHHGNVPAGTVGTVVRLEKYGSLCVVSFPVCEEFRCECYQTAQARFDNPGNLLKPA